VTIEIEIRIGGGTAWDHIELQSDLRRSGQVDSGLIEAPLADEQKGTGEVVAVWVQLAPVASVALLLPLAERLLNYLSVWLRRHPDRTLRLRSPGGAIVLDSAKQVDLSRSAAALVGETPSNGRHP
jgi:hypothetical protein